LLSVGAVVPRKDHGTLIVALGGVTDLDWTLTIVGSETRAPGHAAAVRQRVEEHGIRGRVSFAGEVGQAALEDLWSKAALFVASSRHEGYGMAISEALAHGIPVVTTAGGAVATWLDPAAARIVPPGDAGALGAALRELIADRRAYSALRDGAVRAREKLPTWEAAVEAVEAALLRPAADTSALAGPPGPGL
jgi:glycosyltransferase involved in cell wall biosynthesis